MKYILLIFIIFCFTFCGESSDHINNENLLDKPVGGAGSVCVYNNAYQENYEPDAVSYILDNAQDSYVLLEPFENGITQSLVDQIKANGNEVGAYISIGTGENWRDDFDDLEPFLVAKQWGDWEGEYFVNVTNTGAVAIMKKRIDQLSALGFTWVEFDNMDWVHDDDYRSIYGFEATVQDGIDYSNELCDYVHSLGMKCMAKNTTSGVSRFDGVLYESYADDKNWWETSGTRIFLSSGKLVIINHYGEERCDQVYADYLNDYGVGLSFICEDVVSKAYIHYND
ncbi:MAG: endo alpha-1,4 polygalactosaminidase [Marinoscillum sp.]